jgi:hypothetical protein
MHNIQNLKNVHHRLGSSPLILWLLGLAVLFLFACGSIVQIQTSEYLAQGSVIRVAGVAWNVLQQPMLMITGQAPIGQVTSWLYAWVVEIITLVFALALSIAVSKISTVNPLLAKCFAIGAGMLLCLNSYADYSSSPGTNPLVQFLIALAVGGICTCGLPLGVGLIEHGFSEL